MTDFSRTNWAKTEFSRNYTENADIFIVERRRMLSILQSFYLHLLKRGERTSLLDLGCGDGIVTAAIVEVDGSVSATLVDGSEEMLAKAKERLNSFENTHYIQATFQEMLRGETIDGSFDIVASSLAIHHLTMDEKAALFKTVYTLLSSGGYFINIDVVLAPSERLENWYLDLWRDWMNEKKAALGVKSAAHGDIVSRYKENKDNKPDTLTDQLEALKEAGLQDVDCYYKYGIFTMYGGRK